MKQPRDFFETLAKTIVATKPDELTCEDWLNHVGAYVELVAAGGTPDLGCPRVRDHIALCPECAEEFNLLVAALKEERSAANS